MKYTEGAPIFSVDGAQLYRSKQSDTWIGIWVNANLPPNMRYSKDAVEPAFIIPGPRKPKIIESFLLPTLRHLEARPTGMERRNAMPDN